MTSSQRRRPLSAHARSYHQELEPEGLAYSTKNPVLSAREQFYGSDKRAVIVSYANTKTLEEAKLEALNEKIEKEIALKSGWTRKNRQCHSSPASPRYSAGEGAASGDHANRQQTVCLVVPAAAKGNVKPMLILNGQHRVLEVREEGQTGSYRRLVVPGMGVSSCSNLPEDNKKLQPSQCSGESKHRCGSSTTNTKAANPMPCFVAAEPQKCVPQHALCTRQMTMMNSDTFSKMKPRTENDNYSSTVNRAVIGKSPNRWPLNTSVLNKMRTSKSNPKTNPMDQTPSVICNESMRQCSMNIRLFKVIEKKERWSRLFSSAPPVSTKKTTSISRHGVLSINSCSDNGSNDFLKSMNAIKNNIRIPNKYSKITKGSSISSLCSCLKIERILVEGVKEKKMRVYSPTKFLRNRVVQRPRSALW